MPIETSAAARAFRPAVVPLVTHNPYFSVWSMADRLTEEPTKHWTGSARPLSGLVRVDEQTYRRLGNEPANIPAMEQTALEVSTGRTTASSAASRPVPSSGDCT